MIINKEKLKQNIEIYELYHNGLRNRSGAYVLFRNLRLTKKKAKCDVLIFYGEGERMERYNDIEYNLKDFV